MSTRVCLLQRISVGERCVNSINHFLEMIAKEVKNLLGILCQERMSLDDQLLPHKASTYYNQVAEIFSIRGYNAILWVWLGCGLLGLSHILVCV